MNEQRKHAMWVNRLIDAAKGGWIVDLRFGAPTRQYNPATADQWPADRRIPANAIRTVLLGDHTGFDPRGLRIAGARITGDVDLAHITFDYPLHMVRCRIDRPIAFDAAKLAELDLAASHIRSLSVDGATITGALFAHQITTHGMISAVGATIGSQLSLTGAYLNNPGADVLALNGATITVGLIADQITTHGEIRAVGATIGGELNLSGAHLNNPEQWVLDLDGANITGDVSTGDFATATRWLTFKADGLITASNAGFEGHVDLGSAASSSSGHLTVDFSGVEMQQLTLPQSSLTEINLSLAKLTQLNTPTDREPSYPVLATGWAIGAIDGLIRTDHAATRWLNCINKEECSGTNDYRATHLF